MKNKPLRIGVIGLWHLGCVYASGLAQMGHVVQGFDPDDHTVKNLKNGLPPVFEPGLENDIKEHLNKNLSFTDNIENVLQEKDYVFITFDLPVNEKDEVNIKIIDQTSRQIAKFYRGNSIIVISSQAPLGTCRKIMSTLNKNGKKVKLIYFPENIRLGKALECFLQPDRIILGSDLNTIMEKFSSDFSSFKCPIIKMGLESAEMVKHALNAYLATCVSFSSEIADLCELLGADMKDVVTALKSDKRVSQYAPISPGLGFAGATLGRDIQSLKKLGASKNYQVRLFDAVYKVNQDRLTWLIKKIKEVKPNLNGVNVGILGLTYKPGTNTLRRSMSIELINLLKAEGCNLRAYDPVIKDPIENMEFLIISQNYNSFFKDLQIVVLMTEWEEFKSIPIAKKSKLMKERVIFDTKNFFNREILINGDFIVRGTGY